MSDGFDPETDPVVSSRQATVHSAYTRLRARGEDEAANELRQAETLAEQTRIAREVKEFDPEHDSAQNSSQARIRSMYDALLEHGFEEEAEALRSGDTVNEQERHLAHLRAEWGVSTPTGVAEFADATGGEAASG
ncbi:hypothetical protein [Halopelagius fulvigenes]|uniref:Uncharacterized protein n=1 Tax=Halopelagius fulvigenes TaxID=1198324 RepID=A0ABD5TYI0_9EURY